ncbi:MAG: hypothetical protein ACHQQ3_01015 [Gemmatimonadales bacterium]
MTPKKKRAKTKSQPKLRDLSPKKNPKGGGGTYVPRIYSINNPNMLNPQPLPP